MVEAVAHEHMVHVFFSGVERRHAPFRTDDDHAKGVVQRYDQGTDEHDRSIFTGNPDGVLAIESLVLKSKKGQYEADDQ